MRTIIVFDAEGLIALHLFGLTQRYSSGHSVSASGWVPYPSPVFPPSQTTRQITVSAAAHAGRIRCHFGYYTDTVLTALMHIMGTEATSQTWWRRHDGLKLRL